MRAHQVPDAELLSFAAVHDSVSSDAANR
jgi:hypothetical protein